MEALVQSFAKEINGDPLDDFPKLMYADWLEDGGESDLAQAWRVLVEKEKVPILDYAADFMRFSDWRFFPDPTAHKKGTEGHSYWMDRIPTATIPEEMWRRLQNPYRSCFDAYQAAAIAWMEIYEETGIDPLTKLQPYKIGGDAQ